MRRRAHRPGGDMPEELWEPPSDLLDFSAWREWAESRRDWRWLNDPDRAAEWFTRDRRRQVQAIVDRWGGFPPPGQAEMDAQAREWARDPYWRPRWWDWRNAKGARRG